MKLIIGGAFQGKLAYACRLTQITESQIIDGGSCPLESIYTCRCIHSFHLWVRRALREHVDLEIAVKRLLQENEEVIVITNELGYGIVPTDREDRSCREWHGRLCCTLADAAREVHRVVCGIGTVIKSD